MLGLKREEIAKKIGIGAGTVSAIINEVKEQPEYHDIDLLRQTSIMLRQEGLELFLVSFAIRINNLMKENKINGDQLEIIISDFATYCFKNDLSYEKLIDAGLKALELADKFNIKMELLPDYLTQATTKLERSEGQMQEILDRTMSAQSVLDITLAELERVGGERALIEQNKKLEIELIEAKLSEENYKQRIEASERRWQDESRLASKLDEQTVELNHKLVECQEKLDKLREETGWNYRHARARQETDLD
jgi:transcriptional regulator with XRE-family HTH domain